MAKHDRTRSRRPPEAVDSRPNSGRASDPVSKSGDVPAADVRRRRPLLLGIALVVITFIVFHQALGNHYFTYDDSTQVYNNPRLNPITPANVLYFWWHPIGKDRTDARALEGHITQGTLTLLPYEQLYAPVFFTAYAILAEIGRLPHTMNEPGIGDYQYDPHVFHTANVILHIVNVLLVFALLRLLIRKDWPAAAGALLFGIHPVQVEPVSWITGLNNVLSGTFGFAALYLYLLAAGERYGKATEGTDAPAARPLRAAGVAPGTVVRRRLQLTVALCLYILALLTKPISVSLFPIAWLLDVFVVNRARLTTGNLSPPAPLPSRERGVRGVHTSPQPSPWKGEGAMGVLREATIGIIPWALFAALDVAINAGSQPDLSGDPQIAAPFWFRPLLMADSFAFYLGKLVWPAALGVDYSRTPHILYMHGTPYATCWVFLASVLALIAVRHRYPLTAVSGIIFFISLLPMSGIVPYYFHSTSVVADRYLYLAMFAPALALAEVLARRPGPIAAAVAGALLLGLAVRSTIQETYWHDSATIFSHSLAVNPNSYVVNYDYGVLLFDQHNAQGSAAALERAVRIRPTDDAKYELARALCECGKIRQRAGDIAEAGACYREALQWDPDLFDAHGLLGDVMLARRDYPDAEAQMRDAVALEGNSAMAHYGLGFVLDAEGKTAEAMQEYGTALQLNPGYTPAEQAIARLSSSQKLSGNGASKSSAIH